MNDVVDATGDFTSLFFLFFVDKFVLVLRREVGSAKGGGGGAGGGLSSGWTGHDCSTEETVFDTLME